MEHGCLAILGAYEADAFGDETVKERSQRDKLHAQHSLAISAVAYAIQ